MTITTPIRLGDELSLPVDLVTEAIAILGRRGKGKTNTAGVIVEEFVKLGVPVCVVDTVGVWWGLRSNSAGDGPGLPVVVFGGSHADVPLEEGAGRVIAEVIVDRRISAIIDTSLLSKAAARRFLTAFVTELYHRNRQPMHVVFDEADELAPQNPRAEGAPLLGAMEDFVRRGRARGLGCTLVTQRPAVLNKDVLTQIEVLIAHGLTGPRDVAAIDEWVRLHADTDQAAKVKKTLASLPTGRAWVWSPSWLEILELVNVRARDTFDSSATPKVGQVDRLIPQARSTIDLAELGAAIATTIEKAAAENPAALRAEISRLRAQLTAKTTTNPVEVRVEVPVPTLTAEDRERLDQVHALLERTHTLLTSTADDVAHAFAELKHIQTTPTQPETPAIRTPSMTATPRPAEASSAPKAAGASTGAVGKAERAILAALATHGTKSSTQIALLTGYSSKGGGFANALGKLRSAGRIAGSKDALEITPVGVDALGAYDPLPTGSQLVDYWLSRLGKAERAILNTLVDAWPASLSNEEISELTGYTASGGGFANALGRLRTLELITGPRTANTAAAELGAAGRR
ncbi:ATP-binding protein [Microbacterium oleivorans]|uniref:ATP-binding protein n=1 Tax=Microbacterium oleivorans TaxID=273677 RepID=UPI00080E9125|nr:helicase HerA-like domain-containing protein [Microbacterium oleivorans]